MQLSSSVEAAAIGGRGSCVLEVALDVGGLDGRGFRNFAPSERFFPLLAGGGGMVT